MTVARKMSQHTEIQSSEHQPRCSKMLQGLLGSHLLVVWEACALDQGTEQSVFSRVYTGPVYLDDGIQED